MTDNRVAIGTAILDYLVEAFMGIAPHDALSSKIKSALMRWRGAGVGERVKIWRGVWVDDYRQLNLGDDISIGQSAMFICGGGIRVGNRVMVAHGSKIVSSGHRIPEDAEAPMRFTGPASAEIVIEDDAWIGAGAIVLPGVTVGEGAVVAAGAVVTGDVEPRTIVGGNPAKLIRRR